MFEFLNRKKGAVTWNELIPWVIGIVVLALMIMLYFIFGSKGAGALEYIKNLFRFGR